MPRIKVGIDIDATKEHVFAAAEPVNMPEWTVHVKEVTVTSGDGRSAGTTDRTVIQVTPRRNRLDSQWTEYNTGEAWARKFTGYFVGQERMTFTPANGGTRVEWLYDYSPPYGILGRFGAWFMMSRVVQNNMESSLENLKTALES
jgi:hypothetical protein